MPISINKPKRVGKKKYEPTMMSIMAILIAIPNFLFITIKYLRRWLRKTGFVVIC